MKHLIVIAGPTASGKTSLSIEIAKTLNTEIINADSRQFYKEMNIGTAKPTGEQLEEITHHFVSFLSIQDEYSAGTFMEDSRKKIKELFLQHDLVIITGGSGLYIQAVCKGLDNFPKTGPEVRQELNDLYKESGIARLQEMLKEKDPEYYEEVDLNNPRRLIRALEVTIIGGKPYSEFRKALKKTSDFNTIKIGILTEREELFLRINQRVDEMIENGLMDEARSLYPFRHLNALQTVGYQELFLYFDGETDIETAVEKVRQNSRNYAKRQMTWLRKDKEISWFKRNEVEKILSFINKKVRRA